MKGFKRIKTFTFAVGLSLAMFLAAAAPVYAQSFYGAIVGTVTDPTGAVVPNAEVKATNLGTNESVTVESDSAGKFNIVNLGPATYKLDVTKQSFKRFVQDKVTVEVGNTIRVDAALQVGTIDETVEVSTEAAQLKTDSTC
jgi:muramidase (phage lysozyme)